MSLHAAHTRVMTELFPSGTILKSPKGSFDVEIFGHAPGALDGDDAYVCTFIKDGEEVGEDLVPVSRAHDTSEFVKWDPPPPAEEEWWPDSGAGKSGGKPQGHPPSTIDDTPISPFRETTSRSQDENAEGEPGTHAPAPTPNSDPTPPAPKPPRPKKPKPGRGDDAFNPGARLCNPKAKPPINFIAEVLSYDGDKDRYKCKFIDAKGKKLDQDNIPGTRLHDPKEFRVMSAGQRLATPPASADVSRSATPSSIKPKMPKTGSANQIAPTHGKPPQKAQKTQKTHTASANSTGEFPDGEKDGKKKKKGPKRDWRTRIPKFARPVTDKCFGKIPNDVNDDPDGLTPSNRELVDAMKTLDDLDAATDIAAVKETLANMTSKEECGQHDWTTKTKSGWNVFQIAAREGCGDALDNLHMNCVKRGVSTVAQVNRGKWKQPENAVTMEWLVEQKSPDGRNMLHLIAAGWDKLEDHDQPEVASLAKGIINKMSPKQFRVQAPAHGTCVHACAEAGTGAFFRFLLEHGGGDCTQVKCAPDPNPVHTPAKTFGQKMKKMFYRAAPGVKPRAKAKDAKTPLELARAALDQAEAEEREALGLLKNAARTEAVEDGMTSGAPSPVGFKPTGDGARKIERKILKMQRKLVGLRKCVEELVAHERIFMKTESKKERARARAEDDTEEAPHEAQVAGWLGKPISGSDWTEDGDGNVTRTVRHTQEGDVY